ncbi:annexin-like protein RJ4 [Oryza brachyantha]|uniref:Annexin n=1 Tax=Oryza brachyantha TaxID=4533 RepID=J3L084_ORYBR|nr:annexin-like protein RJ4 [Oryza brachyantha]
MTTIVVPPVIPTPAEDADALLKAFQGWGTDERTVIAVLAHRDATQRKKIRMAYEENYNENFIQRLQSELSGHFERAMYHWVLDPVERQAVMANTATRCIHEDYPVIVEIACVNSSPELVAVKRAYHVLYKCSLEEDVAARATGNLRSLLLALVSTYRYDGDEVNDALAKSEAKILHETVMNSSETDHGELIRIVGTRSRAQLNATFGWFRDEHGSSITKALHCGADPTGYSHALRTSVRCISDANKYFVKVLKNAMHKSGTDEDSLTRVIVMHAEKDLKSIKDAFQKRASVSLEQSIAKDTSGDYKSFLMALLGKSGI